MEDQFLYSKSGGGVQAKRGANDHISNRRSLHAGDQDSFILFAGVDPSIKNNAAAWQDREGRYQTLDVGGIRKIETFARIWKELEPLELVVGIECPPLALKGASTVLACMNEWVRMIEEQFPKIATIYPLNPKSWQTRLKNVPSNLKGPKQRSLWYCCHALGFDLPKDRHHEADALVMLEYTKFECWLSQTKTNHALLKRGKKR